MPRHFFFPARAVFAFAVVRAQGRGDLGQFLALFGIVGGRHGKGKPEQQKFALEIRGQIQRFVTLAFLDQFGGSLDDLFVGGRGENLGIASDVSLCDPFGARSHDGKLLQFGFGFRHECLRIGDGGGRWGASC